jgi:shikimate dehydrogenase
MHNAAAEDLDLDLVYVPLPVRPDELSQAVRGLAALGYYGANVTVPHKEATTLLVDTLDPAAQEIGAVNTIVIRRNTSEQENQPVLEGYNTDHIGFLADLEDMGWVPEGRNCLVLGAGGSARAVVYALAKAGAKVSVAGRRINQARRLVKDLLAGLNDGWMQANDWQDLETICSQHPPSLLVNATPVGMAPASNESPWPKDLSFPQVTLVYDLVYNPVETMFMKQAAAAGIRTANGLGMLVQQGALSFELWTGIKPNTQVMASTLL